MNARFRLLVSLVVGLLLFLSSGRNAHAANASINLNPAGGSFAAPFSVSIVVDGHGDVFNAAQATVSIPPSLTATDLMLGDCNFSFLKTPTVDNPSFEGAILGGSSKKCTVYTLALTPSTQWSAQISLSKASVRKYKSWAEILSVAKGGNYTLTAVVKAVQATLIPTPANGLYSVVVKVLTGDNIPVHQATVILSATSPNVSFTQTTGEAGSVQFPIIKQGLYSALVKVEDKKVSETIVNVHGTNHIITLGINLTAQQNNPLLKGAGSVLVAATVSTIVFIVILTVGIILGSVIAFFAIRLIGRKNASA